MGGSLTVLGNELLFRKALDLNSDLLTYIHAKEICCLVFCSCLPNRGLQEKKCR